MKEMCLGETFIRYKTPALLDYRAVSRLLLCIMKYKCIQSIAFSLVVKLNLKGAKKQPSSETVRGRNKNMTEKY